MGSQAFVSDALLDKGYFKCFWQGFSRRLLVPSYQNVKFIKCSAGVAFEREAEKL